MNTITVTYTIKYRLKNNENYVWTNCNKCFNSKTGREIKKVYNNGCIGYSINGNFQSLKKLRKLLIKPKVIKLPF